VTQHDPDNDRRLVVNVRVDALERSYFAENVRLAPGSQPSDRWDVLSRMWGFRMPKIQKCHISPETPWGTRQAILVERDKLVSYLSAARETSTHEYYIRRKSLIYMGDELWAPEDIILQDRKPRKDSGISQFQIIQQDPDITALEAWPAGTLTIRLQIFTVRGKMGNSSGPYRWIWLFGVLAVIGDDNSIALSYPAYVSRSVGCSTAPGRRLNLTWNSIHRQKALCSRDRLPVWRPSYSADCRQRWVIDRHLGNFWVVGSDRLASSQ
jgi:hypothetical protein